MVSLTAIACQHHAVWARRVLRRGIPDTHTHTHTHTLTQDNSHKTDKRLA